MKMIPHDSTTSRITIARMFIAFNLILTIWALVKFSYNKGNTYRLIGASFKFLKKC